MTASIPEDIREEAREIARRREWVHEAIADAIAQERERCAKIAAGFDDGDPESGFSQAAGTIARIIRNQP